MPSTCSWIGGPPPLLRWIELGRAEHRDVALRPVDLEEVDVVELAGARRLVSTASAITSRVRSVRPPRIQSRRPGPGDLRGNDQLVAAAAREPAAEHRLRTPLGRPAFGGTGYISAVSMKLMPCVHRDNRVARARPLRCSARPMSSCRGRPAIRAGRCPVASGISSMPLESRRSVQS